MKQELESIVKEGNYQVIKFKSPCGNHEMEGVIGFNDFETAQEIATKHGLSMVYLNKKSGESEWKFETDADAPIEVDINLFEEDENVRIYTDMWEEDDFADDTLEIAEELEDSKRDSFMAHRKKVWNAISNLDLGELVVVYDDDAIVVSKMRVTNFETKHDHWTLALM